MWKPENSLISPLSWGQSYLMCPPDYFDVVYAINPWMEPDTPVDRALAHDQWQAVVAAIKGAGGTVHTTPAVAELPDMVFTANIGILDATTFYPGQMCHPERRAEVTSATTWMSTRGYSVSGDGLSADIVQEGIGDALPVRGVLIAGYGQRSTLAAHDRLRGLLGTPIVSVELTDPRFYHTDLVLCPLDERRAMVIPSKIANPGPLLDLIAEPLILNDDEAATFCINSIVVGRTVIMPACPPRVERQLRAWGFDVDVVDVSEFIKAGGAIRCLTLPLDLDLAADLHSVSPSTPHLRSAQLGSHHTVDVHPARTPIPN